MKSFSRLLILLLGLLAVAPASADKERLLEGLNGAERARVETLARGGSVHGATAREKALSLAIGGGNGAERARLDTIRRGGSVWGEKPHERAAVLMTGGGNGAERARVETIKRGGSLWSPTKAERLLRPTRGR